MYGLDLTEVNILNFQLWQCCDAKVVSASALCLPADQCPALSLGGPPLAGLNLSGMATLTPGTAAV